MKQIISVLTLIFLNQTTHVFGKLTALRASSNYYNYTRGICLSEDDGGALVWNYVTDLNKFKTFTKFRDTCTFSNSVIDCEMNNDEGCLERWNREDWKMTRSMDTPMGPVFDRRWEAFKEHSLQEYYISLNNMSTIAVPFSVFARSNLNILICKNKNRTDLCYWVVIGGSENSRSVIRRCPTGVPQIEKYAQNYTECTENVYINHNALSLYEWRTFVFTWNSMTRNISLYNLDRLVMSYEDKEDYENPYIFHEIFFSSPQTRYTKSVIRHHNYIFLYTRQYESSLRSAEFFIDNNEICLQLLIGLCEVCEATISLFDVVTKNTVAFVTVSGSSSVHGLPTWQSVEIKSNILSYNNIQLIVTPRLSSSRYNHSSLIWTVTNVRECPPKGCLRIAGDIIYARHQPHSMTCQKVFYHEQSVVNLLSNVELNIELDDGNCDLGYIGPDCFLMCEKILAKDENCKGVAICNTKGCTCPPGFRGPNCLTPCNEGLYGHACSKKCGSCLHNKCGPTGICATNCENNANYTYIPPMCQIRVFKPGEPEIVFPNRTTVVATVRFKWEEKYKKEKLFYSFRIKTLDERFVYEQDKKQIFENTTQLIGIFEGLKFDTSYRIICILFTGQLEISSNWKTVETDCNLPHAPQNFTYSLDSNGAVDFKWLYPKKTCGHDLCCFRIIIQKISSNLRSNASRLFENETLENSVTYDTHDYKKRLNLLPSTLYNISIQTMTINNKTGNTKFFQFQTSASVGLNGDVGISMQKSDPLIVLRIPTVLNDTSDSMTYIIIIGQDICEQNIDLPKNLLEHIDKYKTEHVWQIVKRPTDELANKVFKISDNHNGKCTLKNGDLCEIMVIITEIKSINETVIFKYNKLFYFGGPPPTYYEVWFIGVILVFAAISAAFYFYKK